MKLEPIAVDEAVLEDLRRRLDATRWPDEPPPQAYPDVALLFSYCIAGPETFESSQGLQQRQDVERRIEAAVEAGDSFDAQIVLMALHAKLINAEVVERYGLGAD